MKQIVIVEYEEKEITSGSFVLGGELTLYTDASIQT